MKDKILDFLLAIFLITLVFSLITGGGAAFQLFGANGPIYMLVAILVLVILIFVPARVRAGILLMVLFGLMVLAVAWYANRLTVDARRPAPDEMVGIFAAIGLTGPFWDPKADQWRMAR